MNFKKILVIIIVLIIIFSAGYLAVSNYDTLKLNGNNITNNTTYDVNNTTVNQSEVVINISSNTTNGSIVSNETSINGILVNSNSTEGWTWSNGSQQFYKEFSDSSGTKHIIYRDNADHIEYLENGDVFYNGENITKAFNEDLSK